MKLDIRFWVVFLAVYNIWYGAFCWNSLGYAGVLLGSIFMVLGGIVGVLLFKIKLRRLKNEPQNPKTNA